MKRRWVSLKSQEGHRGRERQAVLNEFYDGKEEDLTSLRSTLVYLFMDR
jgi:hypothetical protein